MSNQSCNNPFIDDETRSRTISNIASGLTLLEDIEILRTNASGADIDHALSVAGSFGYHLLVEAIREAVHSLDDRPALKEVDNG